MTATEGPFPVIERVEINPIGIAAYTREWDFTVLASELLREVASYICVAACTMGSKPVWDRDQAAVGFEASHACNYRCNAFSTVMAIQAAPERPCLVAVALSTATTSGVSGTLMIMSRPLSRL
jgi:hypothetical protein